MNPKFHVMILIFHRPSVEIIVDKGTNIHIRAVFEPIADFSAETNEIGFCTTGHQVTLHQHDVQPIATHWVAVIFPWHRR